MPDVDYGKLRDAQGRTPGQVLHDELYRSLFASGSVPPGIPPVKGRHGKAHEASAAAVLAAFAPALLAEEREKREAAEQVLDQEREVTLDIMRERDQLAETAARLRRVAKQALSAYHKKTSLPDAFDYDVDQEDEPNG